MQGPMLLILYFPEFNETYVQKEILSISVTGLCSFVFFFISMLHDLCIAAFHEFFISLLIIK